MQKKSTLEEHYLLANFLCFSDTSLTNFYLTISDRCGVKFINGLKKSCWQWLVYLMQSFLNISGDSLSFENLLYNLNFLRPGFLILCGLNSHLSKYALFPPVLCSKNALMSPICSYVTNIWSKLL